MDWGQGELYTWKLTHLSQLFMNLSINHLTALFNVLAFVVAINSVKNSPTPIHSTPHTCHIKPESCQRCKKQIHKMCFMWEDLFDNGMKFIEQVRHWWHEKPLASHFYFWRKLKPKSKSIILWIWCLKWEGDGQHEEQLGLRLNIPHNLNFLFE